MDEENQEMLQEIKRLYYIIDLLIKENRRLQAILPDNLKGEALNNEDSAAYLKGILENDLVSSNPRQENTLKQSFKSNPQEENVSTQVFPSNPPKENVSTQVFPSNLHEGNVLTQVFSSNLQEENVSTQVFPSNPQEENVPAQVFSSKSLKENEFTQPVLQDAASAFATKQVNIIGALKNMRVDNVTASRKSVKNGIKLLQHLANNPHNNTKQLAKATGMSESGLSKRLSALRKQGYVTKLKVRHYVLTQKALDVLGL